MNRAALRTRLLEGLNDPDGAFVSTTQADALLDEAMETLAESTRAIRRTYFLALEPGVWAYRLEALGPDVLAPFRLWRTGDDQRLEPTSLAGLDRRHAQWQQVTGDPECWFPIDHQSFGLWPIPAGGLLRVDAYAYPRALQDDEDEPEFLAADHDSLVTYGIALGRLKRWDALGHFDAVAEVSKAWGLSAGRTATRAARPQRREATR